MNEVVLVTGSETLTGRKLIEKLLARGSRVVAPVAGRETDTGAGGTPDLTVLTWNRASWFSTKAVVREAIRVHQRLDAAWLLHPATAARVPFAEAATGDIESVLEHSVKSTVAMVRELTPHLSDSGGFLGMVLPHRSGGPPDPLDALAKGAFAEFAGAVFRESPPSVFACGFIGHSPDADGFTDHLLRLQGERPEKLRSRWFRYTEGRRPFGGTGFADSAG